MSCHVMSCAYSTVLNYTSYTNKQTNKPFQEPFIQIYLRNLPHRQLLILRHLKIRSDLADYKTDINHSLAALRLEAYLKWYILPYLQVSAPLITRAFTAYHLGIDAVKMCIAAYIK
jgi:hypothetical protein